MKLFDETESKYYELIAYLVILERDFTGAEIDSLYYELFCGEKDIDITESLFSRKEGSEVLFKFSGGKYTPLLKGTFPVRCNEIERQAFGSLPDIEYSDMFLQPDTIQKILSIDERIPKEWDIGDVSIKNRHLHSNNMEEDNSDNKKKLLTVIKAIENKAAIIFDNNREGAYSYKDTCAYPVKIEYSVLNDVFRISLYLAGEERFFKTNLDTMSNIRLGEKAEISLAEKYKEFLVSNRRTIILDVEPVAHAVERCFRVFSFYERKAVYNREDSTYRLEITYNAFDEAEIIRDIMSLGSSVIVQEPTGMRNKIYERILAASRLYEVKDSGY